MDIFKINYRLLLYYIILILFVNTYVNGICTILKSTVSCAGPKWKEDLMPIENYSFTSLVVSSCTENLDVSQPQAAPLSSSIADQAAVSEADPISLDMDISIFHNFYRMSNLTITGCQLQQPPTNRLKMDSLYKLDLSHNDIDGRAHGVRDQTLLVNAPNLRELDLSHNKLVQLPRAWLECPSRIEILILDFNQLAGLDSGLDNCLTSLRSLSLRHNRLRKITRSPDRPILALDESQQPMTAEDRFSFRPAMLDPSPVDGDTGPELTDGRLPFHKQQQPRQKVQSKKRRRSKNKRPHANELPLLKQLEHLDLSHNRLRSLKNLPLADMHSLRRLSLAHNLFRFRSKLGNPSVCDLGTASILIRPSKLPSAVPVVSGLHELDISFNPGITRIQKCWTFGAYQIRVLRMSHCSITEIERDSLGKMTQLAELDLSYNPLRSIPAELALVAPSLRHLSLAANNLSQVTSDKLINFIQLRTLNLSHNEFRGLSALLSTPGSQDRNPVGLLSRMSMLVSLDLSHNNISRISVRDQLPSSLRHPGPMHSIDLRDNPRLSRLSFDMDPRAVTVSLLQLRISPDAPLSCHCASSLITWIRLRHVSTQALCADPPEVKGQSITSVAALRAASRADCPRQSSNHNFPLDGTESGHRNSGPIYRLRLSSNANLTTGTGNSRLDSEQSRGERDRQQHWVSRGGNLTLACEFSYTGPRHWRPVFEWRRDRPPSESPLTSRRHQQQKSLGQPLHPQPPRELSSSGSKTEALNQYDPRIKINTLGPLPASFELGTRFDMSSIMRVQNSSLTKEPNLTGAGQKQLGRFGAFKFVSYLLLDHTGRPDTARYYCYVSGLPVSEFYSQRHMFSDKLHVSVFDPPRFSSVPPNPLSILEGETAEIVCRSHGYPLPVTSLRLASPPNPKPGSQQSQQPWFPAATGHRMLVYKDDDASFHITDVRHEDAGNYSCTSRNPAGAVTFTFRLNVQMRASIRDDNELPAGAQGRLAVVQDRPLILRYRIGGVPQPTLSWTKDARSLATGDRVRLSADGGMLVVARARPDDAGVYQLTALNALGNAQATISVSVIASNSDVPWSGTQPPLPAPGRGLSDESNDKPAWMGDYWLSSVIIIAVLSVLLTSVLWVLLLVCCSRCCSCLHPLPDPKKQHQLQQQQRVLLVPSPGIPMSLTTSTIVRHQAPPQQLPQLQQDMDRCHNSPSLLLKAVSSPTHCDSGIDSSAHPYTDATINGSDVSSVYQCCQHSKLLSVPMRPSVVSPPSAAAAAGHSPTMPASSTSSSPSSDMASSPPPLRHNSVPVM